MPKVKEHQFGFDIVLLEGPALMVEKAEVDAALLPSAGGSSEGLLKVS